MQDVFLNHLFLISSSFEDKGLNFGWSRGYKRRRGRDGSAAESHEEDTRENWVRALSGSLRSNKRRTH